MAQTVSITNNGNGKFTIKDSDGQTRIVDLATANAESAKSKVKITNPVPNPSASSGLPNPMATGYNNPAGANYPTDEKTVLIAGKPTPVSQAVSQAYGAKNLGLIRSNLIKYGQLTKTEARDPNNLLNKWAQIVYGAANDPDPKNNDPFAYAASLQKAGFTSTAGTGYTGPMAYPTITSAEDAKSEITKIWQDQLNRLPTAAEVAAATKALNADEKKPGNVKTSTPIKNAAGQITGYQTTGGTNIGQFLTDYIQANKSLKQEADKVLTTAPEVTQLAKDKKTFDDLIAAAKGDMEKINEARQNTTYGRTLSEYEAQITDKVRTAGATNDPASVSNMAKYLLDRGLKLNSESAQSYLDSQLSFGKGKVTTGDKTTEMYTGKAGSNVEALNQVALANGLDLNKVFDAPTLNNVLSAVQAGENIDTYAKILRDAAQVAWNVPDNVAKLMDQGISLDSIYSPYKNTLADTLELSRNDVTLNDLAKYGIIGQPSANSQAPQNLYDFSKALRKDDRWQYTQQAHNEVGNAVQKVLQDFGFMG